jgi:hypothetical protein
VQHQFPGEIVHTERCLQEIDMTHIIRIGTRYFTARRSYFGGLTSRQNATVFSLHDATERASRIAGAVAVPL